jgi:hypothetical protein
MVENAVVAEVLAEDVIMSILGIIIPMIGKAFYRNNALKSLEARGTLPYHNNAKVVPDDASMLTGVLLQHVTLYNSPILV